VQKSGSHSRPRMRSAAATVRRPGAKMTPASSIRTFDQVGHEPQRVVGDLLKAEISEKQARSIKYQLTIAKLPLAKDLADFQFEGTPINQTLVHDLAGGAFFAQQRNVVLVGGSESDSYCPSLYAVRMPSHFVADCQTTAADCGVDPQRA